jgi:hypothetical protein
MKNTLFIQFLGLVACFLCFGCNLKEVDAPVNTYVAHYNPFPGKSTFVADMTATFDGGYAMTGTVTDGVPKLFVAKYDQNGNELFVKTYFNGESRGNAIIELSNTNLAICGNENNKDGILFKVNTTGDMIEKVLRIDGGFVNFLGLIEAELGKIIVIGVLNEGNTDNNTSTAIICKTPDGIFGNGDVLTPTKWYFGQNQNGKPVGDSPSGICKCPEGYIIVGNVDDNGDGKYSKGGFTLKIKENLMKIDQYENYFPFTSKFDYSIKGITADKSGGAVFCYQDKRGGSPSGILKIGSDLKIIGDTVLLPGVGLNLVSDITKNIDNTGYAVCGQKNGHSYLWFFNDALKLTGGQSAYRNVMTFPTACCVSKAADSPGYGLSGVFQDTLNTQILLIKTDPEGNAQ